MSGNTAFSFAEQEAMSPQVALSRNSAGVLMRLNVEYLRWASKIKGFTAGETARFSRRRFMQGAAAAGLGQALPLWQPDPIRFHHDGERAAFLVEEVERWVFTPDTLVGAHLKVQKHSGTEVSLMIVGGRFAGTAMPFDLHIDARQEMFGWKYTFLLPKQRLKAEGSLRAWLAGEPAVWRRARSLDLLAPDSPFQVRSPERSTLSLDRLWKLSVVGRTQVVLPGGPHVLEADGFQISPSCRTEDLEPLASHEGAFSRVTVLRERHVWGLDFVELLKTPVVQVDPDVEMFDQMHLDAWEAVGPEVRLAASFSGSRNEAFPAILHGDARAAGGGPVKLPLVRPSYSVAVEDGKVEAAFFAAMKQPVAACSADHVVMLDGQVEITKQIASSAEISAFLGASKISVNHFEQPDGTQFDFLLPPDFRLPALHLNHHVTWVERGFDAIEQFFVSLFSAGHFRCSLNGVIVRMLRPADMLYLHFSFDGLMVKMHAGKPFLEPDRNGKTEAPRATMTVHFPPQNQQEQSFYELANGQPPPGENEQPKPRVKISSAGPSRLRFTIPRSVLDDGLPLCVESLLGWERFLFQPGGSGRDGTRIEVPYRLYLTPYKTATFLHDAKPRRMVKSIPNITEQRGETPALWGTLLQDKNWLARQGFDASAIAMRAFGAGDVAEIVKLQVTATGPTVTVRAYFAEPLLFVKGAANVYAAGRSSMTYTRKDHVVMITAVPAPDPQLPGLHSVEYQYLSHDAAPAVGSVITLPYSLWLVQAPAQGEIGGVPRSPMAASDRAQILVLTSGEPAKRLNVNRLMLTSVGAWLDADTKWDVTASPALDLVLDLVAWKHVAVMGRDEYVQVEHEGYLWPFGHRATKQTRTQRTFFSVAPVDTCEKGRIFCYLRQQEFIHITQPALTYPDSRQKNMARNFMFRRVKITTETTPPLDPPPATGAFFPKVTLPGSKPFKFDLVGYDWAVPAAPVKFKAPLIFVPKFDNVNMATTFTTIQNMYLDKTAFVDGPGNVVPIGGQDIHYAPSAPAENSQSWNPADTLLKTNCITFDAALMDTQCTDKCDLPNFYPVMNAADAIVPSVHTLTGKPDVYTVHYEKNYIANGFNPALDETAIFLTVDAEASGPNAGKPKQLSFPGQHGGGIAGPSMPVRNISRSHGVTGTLPHPKGQAPAPQPGLSLMSCFDLESADIFPKLFGVISILDLIDSNLGPAMDSLPPVVPNFLDAAVVAYQQFNDKVQAAQAQVNELKGLLQQSRGQITQRCVQLLMKPEVQQAIVSQLPASMQTRLQDASKTLKQERIKFDAKVQALKVEERKKLTELEDSAEAALDSIVSDIAQRVGPAIAEAITNLALEVFQLEQLLDEVENIVAQVRSAETNALAQLKVIESTLKGFSSQDVVSCLTGSCNDLEAKVAAFVRALVEAEMKLLVGRVSTGIVLQIAEPVIELQDQVDALLDHYRDAQTAAFEAALAATTTLTAPARQAIEEAKQQYDAALTSAQAAVNDAVAQAENAATEQIAAIINDGAVGDFVNFVMVNAGPVMTTIDRVNKDVAIALQFLQDILEIVQAVQDLLNTPIQYGVDYKLPPLKLDSKSGIFRTYDDTRLSIDTKINVTNPPVASLKLDPTIKYQVDASINHFDIVLLGTGGAADFIKVTFDSVTFTSRSGDHPHVNCKLRDVNFQGPLQFVNGFRDAFNPMKSGKSGPIIVVDAVGLSLGYGFAFSNIEGGGFQITGLYFGVQVTLSFESKPLRMKFYFARPEKHFLMSAGIWGGGGYLILEGGPKNGAGSFIDAFQLCMEFGATVALDLGVADGEAHCLGGLYIAMSSGACTLTGFIRAGGSMNILGIVTMSIEWYIGLTSESQGGETRVYGRASVSVSISIGFFSVSATLSMEWTWKGSPAQKTASLPIGQGHRGGIVPALFHVASRPSLRFVADYDAPPAMAPAVGGVTPNRMQYITEDIWNRYASAFARVKPN